VNCHFSCYDCLFVHFNVFSVNVLAGVVCHLSLITLSFENIPVVFFYFCAGLTTLRDFESKSSVLIGYTNLPLHFVFFVHEFVNPVLNHHFFDLSLL
jgi:hypothetical protein